MREYCVQEILQAGLAPAMDPVHAVQPMDHRDPLTSRLQQSAEILFRPADHQKRIDIRSVRIEMDLSLSGLLRPGDQVSLEGPRASQ